MGVLSHPNGGGDFRTPMDDGARLHPRVCNMIHPYGCAPTPLGLTVYPAGCYTAGVGYDNVPLETFFRSATVVVALSDVRESPATQALCIPVWELKS